MAWTFTVDGLTGSGAGSITVNETVSADVPARGYLRLGTGATYEIEQYSSWSGKVFTLVGTTSYSHSDNEDMAAVGPSFDHGINESNESPQTSESRSGFGGIVSAIQRLPTDPFYYADVDVENAVVGSRYELGYDVSGVFTSFTPSIQGTVATSAFTLSNVPSLASPMLLWLRMRKGSAATKYQPLNQKSFHSVNGVTFYVSQVEDKVA